MLAVIILMAACVSPPADRTYQKDGKVYRQPNGAFFRHRWWNYYERGLSYAEGRYFEEALADLQAAVRQREQDQRMARTYGMHFIDYFPHREIGILLYEKGDLDAAQRELELSLQYSPTAKARYYIDQIRKRRIEQSLIEVPPPKIILAEPSEEMWTREDPVLIKGSAESEHFISKLTIEGERFFQEGAQRQISFSKELNLGQGHHEIQLLASDLGGKTASRVLMVNVDRQGPMIVLNRVTGMSLKGACAVLLQGTLYDEVGVRQLEINGHAISINQGKEATFNHIIQSEGRFIDLAATDLLGNKTTARIDQNVIATVHRPPFLLAGLESDISAIYLAQQTAVEDRTPPVISLKDWANYQTVFMPKIYLEGLVSDDSEVTAITINQQPVLKKKGKHIIFSWFFDLQVGENNIRVVARDIAGNVATRDIIVERKIPEALQLNARYKVTLLPFDNKGELTEGGMLFNDQLINAFVKQNRFRVVERNLLDLILQEQKLSQSQLVDRGTALKIGQLVAAQSIVAGSIVISRNGVEIVSRMIDTETSEIMATEDAYDEVKDLHSLGSLAEGIAIKYHQDFPLVNGLVIDKKGKSILINLGLEDIKKQRRILVYREEEVLHPATGKILGTDKQIVGRARLTQIDTTISKAELVDVSANEVQILYKVITE
jgi:TolB-like protein